MKKLISLLVVLSIVLTMSVTAFAAPTIEYVFGGTEEDGNYYYYMFGENDTAATEVGITIEGKDKLFNLNAEGLTAAQSSGKYGIGIADPENYLGASFTVKPYQVVSSVLDEGAEQVIVKAEVADSDVAEETAGLTSLSVKNADGDELISDFDAATTTYYVPVSALTDELTITPVAYNAEASTVKEDANNQYVVTVTANSETVETYYVKYRVPVSAEVTYNSLGIANAGIELDGITCIYKLWFGDNWPALKLRPEMDSYMAYKIDSNSPVKLVSAKLSETPIRNDAPKEVAYNEAIIGNTISVYQNVHNFENVYDSTNGTMKDLSSLAVTTDNAVFLNSYACTADDIVATNTVYNSKGTSGSRMVGRLAEMSLDVSKMQVYDGNVILLYAKCANGYTNSETDCCMNYVPPVLMVEYIVCD